jgi:hypothetical protein
VSPSPIPDTDDPDPASVLALVLLLAAVPVALLAAYLFYRMNRVGPAWLKAHITVQARPGAGPTFRILSGNGPGRDHAFTVIPAEVGRATTVQENRS